MQRPEGKSRELLRLGIQLDLIIPIATTAAEYRSKDINNRTPQRRGNITRISRRLGRSHHERRRGHFRGGFRRRFRGRVSKRSDLMHGFIMIHQRFNRNLGKFSIGNRLHTFSVGGHDVIIWECISRQVEKKDGGD